MMMKKKIIVLVGIVASLLIITGLFVFAANKNTTQSINFGDKVYKLESKTFKFNNKVYQLKNVSTDESGRSTNVYFTDNETMDTYHSAIAIDEFPNTDFNTMVKNTSDFIKNGDKTNFLFIKAEPINQNTFFVGQCKLSPVTNAKNPYVECEYINMQKGKNGNSTIVFDYIRRYLKDDGILTNKDFPKVIESDYAKIKPYITTVKAPDVVSKEKFSKQRSLENIIKDKVK